MLTMRKGSANYLVSEATGFRSREEVIVSGMAGAAIAAGTILGRLTASAAAGAAQAGNTGNATISAVTVTAVADVGVYVVEFTAATTFTVTSPSGQVIGSGSTGVAFSLGGLTFTCTAGGTPMVAGDGFNITVTKVIGNYVPHVIAGADGSQTVSGILFEEVPEGLEDHKRTITARDSEVTGLVYPAGATAPQIATINAALAALGIIVR